MREFEPFYLVSYAGRYCAARNLAAAMSRAELDHGQIGHWTVIQARSSWDAEAREGIQEGQWKEFNTDDVLDRYGQVEL
jgi:hypothetical protein